jgi:hypothetical protein
MSATIQFELMMTSLMQIIKPQSVIKFFSLFSLQLIILCWLDTQPANAGCSAISTPCSSAAMEINRFCEDYPGWNPDRGIAVDVARHQLQLGMQYYYMVYGYWPASWQDVVRAKLIQVPLVGFQGQIIDPDDQSLDFEGDCYYDVSTATSQQVQLLQLLDISGMYIDHIVIPHFTTYEELFMDLENYKLPPAEIAVMRQLNFKQYFAIIGISRSGLDLYYRVYGHYPSTWMDFLNSGLAPINRESINPMTGNPFYGDGRAGDLYYEYLSPDAFKLFHVNLDGSYPEVRFSY